MALNPDMIRALVAPLLAQHERVYVAYGEECRRVYVAPSAPKECRQCLKEHPSFVLENIEDVDDICS